MREAVRACKPGSVSRRPRAVQETEAQDKRAVAIYLASRPGSGPAGRDGVAAVVKQPTRGRAGHSWSLYSALLQVGFGRRCVTAAAGRSYRPISPLPRCEILRCAQNDIRAGAVCFCATFRPPRRTDPLRKPGRYPAPCPVEPGLSSPISPLWSNRGGHPARRASIAKSSISVRRGQLDGQCRVYQITLRSNTKPGSTGSPDTVSGSSITSTSWPGR